jgi:hypothetical protein
MPNRWNIFAQKTNALEKRFFPKVKALINSFRKQVISDIQTHGINQARANLHRAHTFDSLTPLIQSIYKTAGLVGARMQASEFRNLPKAGNFGRNEQWIRSVLDYLKLHLLDFTQDITETMKEDIYKIFDKAINEGWGIDEIVKQLRTQNLVEARARVIARTEIVRAANVGHSIAAKSLPYEVDKSWVAARDHRTRHSHVIANGLTVEEDDTFKVPVFEGKVQTGVDEMQFPGDPTAHPSNTINCRCRVIYNPKRDANGRLILRDQNTATVIPLHRPRQIPVEQIAAQLKGSVTIGVK